MVYQFYLWDVMKGFEFIAEFPERRKNQERITDESVINWARAKIGRNLKADDIYFVKVALGEEENGGSKIILNYSSCLLSIHQVQHGC